MHKKLDHHSLVVALCVVAATLIACKKFKKDEEATPASASVAPASSVPPVEAKAPEPPPEPEGPKVGDVTRYKDKEKEVEGVVKVLENEVKVFNETDEKSKHVAELTKGIFVNRLATIDDDWVLVEFPSGLGELSPGWIEAKFLSSEESKVSEEAVKEQKTVAKVVAKADDKKTEEAKADDKKTEEAKADDKKTEEAKADDKKTEEAKADTKPKKSGSRISLDALKKK